MPDQPQASTVSRAMRPRVPACTLRTPVLELARRMRDEATRTMVVMSAGSDLIAGTVGDLEMLRAVVEGRTDAMASDVMRLEAPSTVGRSENLETAVQRLLEDGVDMLLVVAGDPPRPVGVLSAADVAAMLARE